ncbi:MAG: hypothetical protein NTZ05_01335 [Chloroflexi bacterium]|nr:hypothetical protein [Chloroflexota bacterium]
MALLNIDDIQRVTEANMEERRGEIAKVEQLVDHELEQFLDWWNRRAVTPTVAALRNRAELIRRTELERTLARMPHLSEADRQRLEAMTSAIMKKLLHEPLIRLKSGGADNGYVEAVRGLFALTLDDPASEPAEEHAEEVAEAAAGVQA